eukprot:jgi/Astpho2/8783/Aster-05337
MVALAGTLAPPSRLAWLFVTCNSLAVQCPDAADLWDPVSNGELNLSDVAMQSKKVVAWKGPDVLEALAQDNPLQFIKALANMPAEDQREFLRAVGGNLQAEQGLRCNPFGGTDSCMALPEDSQFASICQEHDLKVGSLAMLTVATIQVSPSGQNGLPGGLRSGGDQRRPHRSCTGDHEERRPGIVGAGLPRVLGRAAQDAHHCSDLNIYSPCFHLQWCSQTVPKCGSFQSNVETGVLPAIASVLNAQELGENAVQALGEAIPGLLQASPAFPVLAGFLHTWGCAESPCQANIDYNKCCMADAMSLAWPCREMCEAVIDSCGCGEQSTFGDLLSGVVAGIDRAHCSRCCPQATDDRIPADFSVQMFGGIANQPLCSLYSPSSAPGFVGFCATPEVTTCTDAGKWCAGTNNPGPKAVQQLMALQLAKAVFGWMAGKGGLLGEEHSIIDDASQDSVTKWEEKYVAPGGPPASKSATKGSVAMGVGFTLLGLAAAVLALIAGYKYYERRRQSSSLAFYENLPEESETLYQAPPQH